MVVPIPAVPYRGIQPFRYADHAVFFAREEEARLLASLVAVYRGVFLYGDSGSGKSSLVNAGLLPQARELGFSPVRVRVQPRAGEELVVEQIATSDEGGEVLPCVLAPGEHEAARIVLSIEQFEERVRDASQEHRPLIVFDQFEEVLTLFEDAVASRRAVAEMIVRLLGQSLPVKLVFAFREDYLGRIKQLLSARPELVDQSLRLGPPSADALETIIRGPFERFPEAFERQLSATLALRLRTALEERFGSGDVSLSEVQTVCLRLWRAPDPEALLARKGVQGLLEDELGEALDAFAPDLRAAAIALLSEMVTAAGTRNVVSAEDLRLRVHADDASIAPALLDEALVRLERDARLVRRERRRDLYLYEITSEFLVPWISTRREQLRREQERRRERRRLRILASISGGLLIVVAVVAAVAVWAIGQRGEARRQAANATSLALATSAAAPSLKARPDVSLALAYEAYRASPRAEASEAVISALLAARRSGLRSVLSRANASAVAFTPSGAIAAAGKSGLVLWNPTIHARHRVPGLRIGESDAIAFSRDGRSVAAAVAGTITVLDTADGKPLSRIRVRRGAGTIVNVAWSAVAKTVAVAFGGHTIEIWSSTTGRRLARLRANRDVLRSRGGQSIRTSRTVAALTFSPDGRTLASGSHDGTVSIWDVRSRTRRARLGRSEGSVGTLAGDVVHLQAGNAVSALAFDADGGLLAVASGVGTDLWKPSTRERLARLGSRRADAVAFSRDGRTLASSDGPGIRLWNTTTRRQIAHLTTADAAESIESIEAIAFSPDGRLLATADPGGPMRLWTTVVHERQASRAGNNSVYALAFNPGAASLAVGTEAGVALWNPRSHERRASLPAGSVDDVAFSPDGKTLAVAGEQGTALWRPATQTLIKRLTAASSEAVAFSPDGRLLASTSPGLIMLWDAARQRPRGAITIRDIDGEKQEIYEVAVSRDAARLASVSSAGVDLWNRATRARIAHLGADVNSKVTFSRASALLAYSDGNAVVLYDTSARRQAGRFTIGESDDIDNDVSALAFSADGRTLVVANSNGLTIWNPAARKRIGQIAEGSGTLVVAISADGRTIAAGSDLGGLRFYNELLWSSPAQLRASVCEVLGGGLAAADWGRYAAGIPQRRLTCP